MAFFYKAESLVRVLVHPIFEHQWCHEPQILLVLRVEVLNMSSLITAISLFKNKDLLTLDNMQKLMSPVGQKVGLDYSE